MELHIYIFFHFFLDDWLKINFHFLEEATSCNCISFITDQGYGDCIKLVAALGNKPACYVSEPSNCPDLLRSRKDPGKQLSAVACEERKGVIKILIINIIIRNLLKN